jgi:hypothetical protein
MIFLQGFIKFDQGISEKCVGQTFDGRKKERIIIIMWEPAGGGGYNL